MKENLSKEVEVIVKTIKVNNEKYLTKISHTDQRVNEVLLDGKKIINDYTKKFAGI